MATLCHQITRSLTPVSNSKDDPGDVASTVAAPVPAIYINPNESLLRATIPPEGGTAEITLTQTGEGATARTVANTPED